MPWSLFGGSRKPTTSVEKLMGTSVSKTVADLTEIRDQNALEEKEALKAAEAELAEYQKISSAREAAFKSDHESRKAAMEKELKKIRDKHETQIVKVDEQYAKDMKAMNAAHEKEEAALKAKVEDARAEVSQAEEWLEVFKPVAERAQNNPTRAKKQSSKKK